jgi:hypothetical protein
MSAWFDRLRSVDDCDRWLKECGKPPEDLMRFHVRALRDLLSNGTKRDGVRTSDVLEAARKAKSAYRKGLTDRAASTSARLDRALQEELESAVQEELSPGNMTLGKAVALLKTVLDHPDPFFHVSLILGAAQDHIIDLLHTIFYLVFSGGPDTGKGTANACAMALTRNGIVLGGASGPYLRDTLDKGRAVAISEFETLLKENQQLLAVVRNGNRRVTAKIGLKVPAGKSWTNAEVDTFGFKTMDYHEQLDAHVLGRALAFEMVRSKNLDVAMNAEYLQERLAPVRRWLLHLADRARKNGWTQERVRVTWDLEEFRARGKAFKNAWGRHGIIVSYLLLIDDIFEFGLEEEIRQLMDAREPELSEAAQEVQEAICDLAGEDLKPTDEFRVSDVLARVNAIRKERGLRERVRIDGVLRELQFNPQNQNWVKARSNWSGPNRGKAVILPYEIVRSWRTATDGTGSNGSNGSTTHREKATDATDAAHPVHEVGIRDQHPDLMFGLEYALMLRRWNPNRPVPWVVEDAIKEFRSKFNKEPTVDQLTAGVIKGMKTRGETSPEASQHG